MFFNDSIDSVHKIGTRYRPIYVLNYITFLWAESWLHKLLVHTKKIRVLDEVLKLQPHVAYCMIILYIYVTMLVKIFWNKLYTDIFLLSYENKSFFLVMCTQALMTVNERLRKLYPDSEELFDIVLMTNNHAQVGVRLMNSINHYGRCAISLCIFIVWMLHKAGCYLSLDKLS